MTRTAARKTLALLGAWSGALALLAGASPAAAQTAPTAPGGPTAGGKAGVRVNLLLDQRRVAEAREKASSFFSLTVYGYALRPGSTVTEIRPDNAELLSRWKGDFVLGSSTSKSTFKSAAQFLPAMLVLDLTNETGAPQQVTNAYLAVESSITDREPLLLLRGYYLDAIEVRNHGWGEAENAQLNIAFGPQQAVSKPTSMALGTFGNLEVSVALALDALVPALPNWRKEPPRCPDLAQVPACYKQLLLSPKVGRLGEVAYFAGSRVLTQMIGQLSYQWRDAAGAVKSRVQPVKAELELFRFRLDSYPLSGAAPPPSAEETGYSTIALDLDRKGYRIPLPYRPRIDAGENKRFQLALAAPKSSSHVFRVVLEMSDGSRVESAPMDWLAFVPMLDVGKARQVR